MQDYIIGCSYDGLKGFRLFINDHIFFDAPGAISSDMNFIVTPFLRAGKNIIRVIGGSMALSHELEGEKIPNMDITLRKIEYFGDNSNILKKYTLKQEDDTGDITEEDGRQVLEWSIDNESDYNYEERFSTFQICNENEDIFKEYYLKKMREFARAMYAAIAGGTVAPIVENSTVKLEDDSLRGYGDFVAVKSIYEDALKNIASKRPMCTVKDERQFIFSPSCSGKLWRVGIMSTAQRGMALQDAVSMLPAALPRFDSELFATAWKEKHTTFLPTYIAFVNDQCSIVR